jgi:photosystem II stability/assembly factor-like uncharacterized protein
MIRQRFLIAVALTVTAAFANAGPLDPDLFAALRWRCIGPFRGGRTVGASGVPGKPGLFYIGVNNGGVWKSTDFGRVWSPIFDDQPTGSIGSIAVAPSNPNVIYVGSGEGLQRPDLSVGDGLYKSTDGGKTWKNMGLRDGQQIPAIIVDPQNPDRVFVAVLGHPYGPNSERGIFRSTDGGATWQKVLYKDENTGGMAVAFDPGNAQAVYAVLWSARQGPWENGDWQGRSSGLFKSTDGGTTWKQLTKGLPTADDGLGRIGFDVSRSDPRRLFALVDAPRSGGLFCSDDGGESWRRVNSDRRIWGRGSDFAEVRIDPKNPERIYVANTACYRSEDGGKSFTCLRGAPGGDDYHTVWISPDDPNVILLATDQGAIISVNGGETFSSWYNQPTAQFYHVATDNRFPYRVYGAQQESGSVCTESCGRDGQVTFRDWQPVGVEEYGYVAPDPLDPDVIYGGKFTRFDRRTGQLQNVSPEAIRSGKYRFLRTAPVIFSPVDPKALYFAGNVLFKTTTGGYSWSVISPDLTREKPEVPESIGVYRAPALASMPRRGVIYTVAPSYKEADTIWCGTDDGLIHLTRDGGKNWSNVTPPALTAWSKVSLMDAGRFDPNTAYVAINRFRLDDLKPHIWRTHDGGKTWAEITHGLPDDPVNVVREDPVRPGLLYCGTERAVFVSFNDGDDWQPLRLNMPCTSIRDLVVHENDLVVGTHGRSFWILDDVSPLRQTTPDLESRDAHLFMPAVATRVRWNQNTDTPLPPEEPAGKNPPDGAVLYYWLGKSADGPVTIEIVMPDGRVFSRFSSTDRPPTLDPNRLDVRPDWARPPQRVSAKKGIHRFVWDLHLPSAGGQPQRLPMTAIRGDTPPEPRGPWVPPGKYTVRLTVDGRTTEQPLVVRMDPRVPASEAVLKEQFQLSLDCWLTERKARSDQVAIQATRRQLADRKERASEALSKQLTALDDKLAAIAGAVAEGRRRGQPRSAEPTLGQVAGELATLSAELQAADAKPTTSVLETIPAVHRVAGDLAKRLQEIRARDLPAVNEKLRDAILPEVSFGQPTAAKPAIPQVRVSDDRKGFVLVPAGHPFVPWGFNYDHDRAGRLIEDYWDFDWPAVQLHFAEMNRIGANVVRVHLQFGKFMAGPESPNEKSLDRLGKLLELAERERLYLDITGLGCYHKPDVPAWYDRLSETDRWDAQAEFWRAVAGRCKDSPAVFCYDLMNEPVVPGGRRADSDWLGPAFAGKHFVQFVALDQTNRPRPEIAKAWVHRLATAIRRVDPHHLITVGLVDWSLDRPGLTSGFVPDKIAVDLDFVSVHLYPKSGKLDVALVTLAGFNVGKPVIIEETFPLACSPKELRKFIDRSASHAAGWVSFYWGTPREGQRSNKLSDGFMWEWLTAFRLGPPK